MYFTHIIYTIVVFWNLALC